MKVAQHEVLGSAPATGKMAKLQAQHEVLGNEAKEDVRPARDDRAGNRRLDPFSVRDLRA
jgi:hypothetical protein